MPIVTTERYTAWVLKLHRERWQEALGRLSEGGYEWPEISAACEDVLKSNVLLTHLMGSDLYTVACEYDMGDREQMRRSLPGSD